MANTGKYRGEHHGTPADLKTRPKHETLQPQTTVEVRKQNDPRARTMVLLKKLRKQENKGGKFLAPPVGGRTVVPKLILANQKIRYTIVDVGTSTNPKSGGTIYSPPPMINVVIFVSRVHF